MTDPHRDSAAVRRPARSTSSATTPRPKAGRRPASGGRVRAAERTDVFLLALVLLALAKAAFARSLALDPTTLFAVALEAATIVVVLGVTDLIPPRRSYSADLVVYSVLCILMLANVVYISVFGQIADPSMLGAIGQAGEVSDSIRSVLRPEYLLFLADIPLLIAWAVLLRRRRSPAEKGRSRRVAIAVGVAALFFLGQLALVRALPVGVDGIAAARSRGFGPYQLSTLLPRKQRDVALAVAKGAGPDGRPLTRGEAVQRQISAIRQGDSGVRIAAFRRGAFKGKNVILIQVESLNGFIIGRRYNGQAITPNLDRLIATSWYFPNTYSQTAGGNTADAEFVANTSLYAPVGKAASTTYSTRKIPALPRILGEQGYQTLTMHTNEVSFWNRKEMYAALGFNRYYDRTLFKDRDKMWRASDEVLFQDGSKVLESADKSQSPFYAQLITMTSHNPFRYPTQKRRPVQVPPKDKASMVGKYIGSISYMDKALGEFITRLKADGLYDNSIIMVYGDHSAMYPKTFTPADKRLLRQLLGRPFNDSDIQRVGLVVHVPGQTAAKVSDEALGEVDITPTIADLVGLDLSGTPHLGRSAFVSAKGLVPTREFLPAGSFINDRVMFEPQLSFADGTAIATGNGAPAVVSSQERIDFDRAATLSAISDEWLSSLPVRPDAAAKQSVGF